MIQTLVLYNAPADTVAFQRYYHQTHIPLAKKIPGATIDNDQRRAGAGLGGRCALSNREPYLRFHA
jgi:uncharacterized protein (TIGR02118 family)